MGNRHSLHNKKIVITKKSSNQIVDTSAINAGFTKQPHVTGNRTEPSEVVTSTVDKEGPPKPCTGVYPKETELEDPNYGYIWPIRNPTSADYSLTPVHCVGESMDEHNGRQETAAVTKSEMVDVAMDSSQREEVDNTIPHLSPDDEVDVYDSIPSSSRSAMIKSKMGNRHSLHNKKIVITKKSSNQIVDTSAINAGFTKQPHVTGNRTEPSEVVTSTVDKEGPPKPCTGVYPKETELEDPNYGYIWPIRNPTSADYSLTPVHCVGESMDEHNGRQETAAVTKSEMVDVAMDSSQREEVDNTIPHLSPDDEVDVYDSIPSSSRSAMTNWENGYVIQSYQNPVYFDRHCFERVSQRTILSKDSGCTTSTDNTHGCQTCSKDYFCYNCLTCRSQNMEYMTEVYKRTLQRDLRVRDILPDLHFIDDLNKEEILKKAKDSRQEAVEMLLESVKASTDEGKWQAFVEALERSDYKFIVKLLKGETENDQENNKTLLSLLSRQLINNINVEECLDLLYENELLNDQDKEVVEAEQKNYGPIAAAYRMFNIVPIRSHEWDKKLPKILEQCGLSDIAKLLQFSSESPTGTNTDQTDLKEYKCSHVTSHGHQYTRMDSRTHRHEIYPHTSQSKTLEVQMSTEVGNAITGLRNHVKDIETEAQKQLSVVTKLERNHSRDLHEVKTTLAQTRNEIKTHMAKCSEQEVSLNDIKSEVKRRECNIIEYIKVIEKQHQRHFAELKGSLSEIKSSISALTKYVYPSLPEPCKQSLPPRAVDSGFSGGSGSLPEECLEDIYTGFGKLHDTEDEFRCRL